MNELENKYLYIINNILQGYDRDIVINHVAELEADLNFALNMSKKRGDEILQLEKEKSELIEAIKEIQELTVKGIPFKNMRHYIQKQCLRMIKKHGVEI